MNDEDLKIKKLKQVIFNQEMQVYRQKIHSYHCPWKFGYVNNKEIDCNKIGCKKCKEDFWEVLKTKTKQEIENLY